MAVPLVGSLPASLSYCTDDEPGFTRVRRGKGFSYHTKMGERLTDTAHLERVKALGIPPAWKKVWIAEDPHGHLQCTGLDPKGRKQYIYHAEWNAYRSEAKFRKLAEFGRALPEIRRTTDEHLKIPDWFRPKVLALVIRILDTHHIRIGNEYYRQQNETYGLTTLRRKHLEFEKGVVRLEYKAKSGKYRKVSIKNNQLAKLVKQSSELRGYELFKYQGEDKKFHHINSHDVNEYLRDISDEDFSCKDFRTWGGTTLAIDKLPEAQRMVTENPRLKLETTLVKLVAKELGNTITICRKYYIHPRVLEVVLEESLDEYRQRKTKRVSTRDKKLLSDSELVVLNIIGE
ncbi:MAG: DNA topoisomerase IB [Tunicatimonas sp.]